MCEGERHCNSTRWRRDAPRLVSHPGGDADCSAIPIDFFEKNFQLIIIRRVKTGVQTGADLHEPVMSLSQRIFFFLFALRLILWLRDQKQQILMSNGHEHGHGHG